MPRHLIARRVIEITWDDIENGEELSDEQSEKLTNIVGEELESHLEGVLGPYMHMKYNLQVEVR